MKWLLRIENLLLFVPIALGGYLYFSFMLDPDTEIAFNPYALVTAQVIVAALSWAWVLLPGYVMHYFLRVIRQRNKVICISHVVLSLLLRWPVSDYATSVVPGWHTTIYAPQSEFGIMVSLGLWLNLLFWLVQITFIVYGFVIINRWRKLSTS